MCRSSTNNDGFPYQMSNRLKIKAFYLRLSISNSTRSRNSLPETITLHYLPRISGTPLEINDSKIRSDSNAFLTLHRFRSAEKDTPDNDVIFTSRERVRVGEAVRFEVYVKEEKLLKGIFRKDDQEEWKLECECALERPRPRGGGGGKGGVEISKAEISVVAADGHVAIIEKVDMRRRRCSKKRGGGGGGGGVLDEIPEEREDGFVEEFDRCDCCGEIDDGEDCSSESAENQDHIETDMEMEGVKWAVDVGIWVVCLGVGYLVSKASSKTLRRRRIIL